VHRLDGERHAIAPRMFQQRRQPVAHALACVRKIARSRRQPAADDDE
jgi:hypothetical protein